MRTSTPPLPRPPVSCRKHRILEEGFVGCGVCAVSVYGVCSLLMCCGGIVLNDFRFLINCWSSVVASVVLPQFVHHSFS